MLHRQIEDLNSLPDYENVAVSMMTIFEGRFGDLTAEKVFVRDIQRGKRRVRKGIPDIAFLAAALDPRTKGLDFLRSNNTSDIIPRKS